jgi:hypothetical protein
VHGQALESGQGRSDEDAPVGQKFMHRLNRVSLERGVHGGSHGPQDGRYGLRRVYTYGTSHPGRWSMKIGRYYGTFGYTERQVSEKAPRSMERKIDRYYGTFGYTGGKSAETTPVEWNRKSSVDRQSSASGHTVSRTVGCTAIRESASVDEL